MSIELVPLFTARLNLAEPISLGKTPKGRRVIVEVESAELEGDRIKASLKGRAAADWALLADDGTLAVDVRYAVETDDGAVILVQYLGRIDLSNGPGAPVYAAPQFETGDARYAWLNRIQAVAKGETADGRVTYETYELR